MDISTIKTLSLPILKNYQVKKAALFGSIVRGTAKVTSDVDILIDPPDRFSLLDLAGLKIDLEEALNRSVDIVEYQAIKPLLKDAILQYEHPIL